MSTVSAAHTLELLLQEIAQEHPRGLRHAEFVRKVLETGYVHQGGQPLSAAIYQILRNGVLVRSDDENKGVREYRSAGLCVA